MSAEAQANVGGVRGMLSRDAAAIYGMIGRLWHILTGPLAIVVLTPYAQDYFFTFISLAAARTVAELGLGQAIIVKMAHWCPPGDRLCTLPTGSRATCQRHVS